MKKDLNVTMNSRLRELMLEAGYAAPELAIRANRLAELVVADACEALKNWETKIWQREPSRRHLFFNEDLAISLIKEHFLCK